MYWWYFCAHTQLFCVFSWTDKIIRAKLIMSLVQKPTIENVLTGQYHVKQYNAMWTFLMDELLIFIFSISRKWISEPLDWGVVTKIQKSRNSIRHHTKIRKWTEQKNKNCTKLKSEFELSVTKDELVHLFLLPHRCNKFKITWICVHIIIWMSETIKRAVKGFRVFTLRWSLFFWRSWWKMPV